ncbi:tyrosine-type recombinase/integrase [Actinomadura rugatobispora]|uniref:Tyrosine-type recombinase/integrase n=1 Tax=Actinomadura rugatobispora TaxID=1994 RepID=A0ABW0ZQ46_9ACTN|nr:tyrosine recombinase XerC [Actinomadura rugatobispora]
MTGAVVPFDPHRRRRTSRRPQPATPPGLTFGAAMNSWTLALQARGRSDRTIGEYVATIEIFTAWLDANDLPDDVEAATAEHIRRFLTHENGRAYNKDNVRKTTQPATAAKHFRNLRALFNWLVKEGERTTPSPVHSEDQPDAPKKHRAALTDEQMSALLATCKKRTFENLRDEAILRLLVDSGPRRSGIAGIRHTPDDDATNDLYLARYRIRIVLKGGDEHLIPIGKKTALAIDRYIRARARHPAAEEPWLWLGQRGRLTGSGIYQMVRERGAMIGVPGLHPHRFRRKSVTEYLNAGGNPIDAMYNFGWKSMAMVDEYTRETARERAAEAHARLSPGDRY